MVPRHATASGRRRLRADDDGAALLIALIFITVVAVAIAISLSVADTSMRTTMALRDQAAYAASADGAAQVAINALRKGSYDGTGGTCFSGGNGLTLANFPTTGDSAY